MKTPSRLRLFPRPHQGSVLIVALLLAGIIGISLVSYLRLSLNSLKLAQRSLLANSAMNYAEIGLEEATYCYNLLSSTPVPEDAWTGNGWTIPAGGHSAVRNFPVFTLENNATATVKAWVDYYNPPPTLMSPKLVVQATVNLNDGSAPIVKMVEVTLRRRSLYAIGLLARNNLDLKPTVSTVDSWNPNPTNDPAAAPIPYSTAVRRSNGTVGSPNPAPNAVDIGMSKIYGYVATGGGSILYSSSAVVSGLFTGSGIDWPRVSYDFAANFVTPVVPIPAVDKSNSITASITSSVSLPRPGDIQNPDGRYYYVFGLGATINLASNNQITVTDKVTMVLDRHNGAAAMTTSGNAGIVISANIPATATVAAKYPALMLYTNGNINAGGTGGFLNNAGMASRCLIYGTNPNPLGQSIMLEGNNVIPPILAIYAPNASFRIDSNADMKGAVIAFNITLNSDTGFHFDESLLNMGGNPFGLTKWRELRTASERAGYASQLAI